MVKKHLVAPLVLSLLLVVATAARAYDFSAPAPTGQTLYYSVVDGGVVVVYPNASNQPAQGWVNYVTPTGVLEVPATVVHDDTTYAVLAVGNHAFYFCEGLTRVVLHEGIASVRANAFNMCSALAEISLPATIDSLGPAALANCTALATIVMHSALPPVCATSTFTGTDLSGVVLQVPCQTVGAYTSATPWSGCGTVSDVGCQFTLAVGVNRPERGSATGGGTYASGTSVVVAAVPADGYFFACWSDGDTLNPRIVQPLHDMTLTAHLFAYRHDTVPTGDTVVVHDTVLQHDTAMATFFRLVVDATAGGIGIGNALLPAGTEAEIGALPLEGFCFDHWNDGVRDNPRRVVVTADAVYTATFATASLSAAEAVDWQLDVDGRTVTILGPQGTPQRLFSADGRLLFERIGSGAATCLRLPAAGVYIVQVGPAGRKIIVE